MRTFEVAKLTSGAQAATVFGHVRAFVHGPFVSAFLAVAVAAVIIVIWVVSEIVIFEIVVSVVVIEIVLQIAHWLMSFTIRKLNQE